MYDYDRLGEKIEEAISISDQVFALCLYAADEDALGKQVFDLTLGRVRRSLTTLEELGVSPFLEPFEDYPFGVLRVIAKRHPRGAVSFGPGVGSCWIEVAFECRQQAVQMLDVARLDPTRPSKWPVIGPENKTTLLKFLPQWKGYSKRKLIAETKIEWCAAAAMEADAMKTTHTPPAGGKRTGLFKPTEKTLRAIELINDGHRTDRQISEMTGVKSVAKVRSRLKTGKYDLTP